MSTNFESADGTTTFNLRCRSCEHGWEFHGQKLEAFEQKCPRCSSSSVARDWKAEKDAKGDFVWRERMFSGSRTESRLHGCHPAEVNEMRELVGGEEARCIKDDGSVHFRSRSQQREYSKRMQKLMQEGRFFNPAMGHV